MSQSGNGAGRGSRPKAKPMPQEPGMWMQCTSIAIIFLFFSFQGQACSQVSQGMIWLPFNLPPGTATFVPPHSMHGRHIYIGAAFLKPDYSVPSI